MFTMNRDLATLHHRALQRQARVRVDQLDELRAVKNAADRGLAQRDIAELLATSQAKVHRLLKAVERRCADLRQDPQELSLRAFAYDTSRNDLVEALKAFPHTFGEDARAPHEGRLGGTWDQVVAAHAQGMLDSGEFDDVRAAISRYEG